jgi:hypothetical protein
MNWDFFCGLVDLLSTYILYINCYLSFVFFVYFSLLLLLCLPVSHSFEFLLFFSARDGTKQYAGLLTGYSTSKQGPRSAGQIDTLVDSRCLCCWNGHAPRQYKGVVSSIANYESW